MLGIIGQDSGASGHMHAGTAARNERRESAKASSLLDTPLESSESIDAEI